MALIHIFSVAAIFLIFVTTLYAGSNIRVTKHNLIPMHEGNIPENVSDEELCVFCHTPSSGKAAIHNDTSWSRSLPGESFVLYGTRSDSGGEAGMTNNPSMPCLGCHDGISAVIIHSTDPVTGGANSTIGKLGNNHPISVHYTPGKASLKSHGESLSGWSGAKNISDLLRNNKIECGSCHDPHEATNGTFLRVRNRGSGLCLGCHGK